MACGTGKTLTALWIKETLKPKTTLVLVPSLNLLAQTLSEWAKNSLSPWQYLCVCSDDTVNKLDDQPISTVSDLPFEVTTNPEDIAKFLSLEGERIIFSTYQSSAQVAKAQEQSGVSFDLVICDEAHRLTGKTDADYATVLDEKKIVGQKRLFMTATPRTYTTAAKTKAEDRGVEITSMDDEHVYGPVLHKLSFGEAIKQDLLSDYRVLIVGVTDPQVQDLIDRRELVSVNDSVNTDARTLAAHIGLAKATKDYNLKRTISFHSRIKSADQFAKDHLMILDWLPETHKPSGITWTGTISGAMNTGDRRRLIKLLSLDDEDRHALLTNARCLTEGVDVPSLDGVAFIDPRSSQVDIIQAVGRAIRKSTNKEVGTIVLPVLIPTDSNAEDAIEDTNFKPIWAVLNALKSHDDDFAGELSTLRTELGRTGRTGELPNRLVEDLPADIDFMIPGFSYKLSLAILHKTTESWDWWFGILLNYADQNGSLPQKSDVVEGFEIGIWLSNQRQRWRDGSLSQKQIDKLISSGVTQRLNAGHGKFFDTFISHLELWISQGGEPNPRQVNGGQNPIMADGYQIADQSAQARRAISGRVKNVLPTQEHLYKLKALGFEFKMMRTKKLRDFDMAFQCINFESPISKATFDQYPIDEIATSSRLHVECICPDCGHTWNTAIRFLTGAETPCPECRLRMPNPRGIKNPIMNHQNWPFISQYWDHKKNSDAGIRPEFIGEGSSWHSAFLKCPDCNTEWQRIISSLRRSFSCPECMKMGRRFRPDVIAEMHLLVQEGVAVEEIAKRFGVLPTVLGRLLLNQSDH
jgi:superfamily II DNA or RNA helicase